MLSTLSSWPASQSVHQGIGDVHCWQPNFSGGRFVGAHGALLWDTKAGEMIITLHLWQVLWCLWFAGTWRGTSSRNSQAGRVSQHGARDLTELYGAAPSRSLILWFKAAISFQVAASLTSSHHCTSHLQHLTSSLSLQTATFKVWKHHETPLSQGQQLIWHYNPLSASYHVEGFRSWWVGMSQPRSSKQHLPLLILFWTLDESARPYPQWESSLALPHTWVEHCPSCSITHLQPWDIQTITHSYSQQLTHI